MYVNIPLFDKDNNELKTVEVEENFNISDFLIENRLFPVDLNFKRFLGDINKAWKKNLTSFLLIDDNPELIEVLTDEARELGHYIEGYTESDSGYERYISNHQIFDIVVLDFKMPGPDGGRVADAMFEANKNARIVILTGDSGPVVDKISKIPIIYKPSTILDIIEAANFYDYQNKFSSIKK